MLEMKKKNKRSWGKQDRFVNLVTQKNKVKKKRRKRKTIKKYKNCKEKYNNQMIRKIRKINQMKMMKIKMTKKYPEKLKIKERVQISQMRQVMGIRKD